MGSLKMHRHRARLPFFLLFSFGFVSIHSSAHEFKDCLAASLFWQPLKESLGPHADVSLLDQAALSLINRGRSFGVRSFRAQDRENGNMMSAAATFRGASAERERLIPKFQDRLKQLSGGKAELISISSEEAGITGAKSDGSYFKLIRHRRTGTYENVVALTDEGFSVLSPAETKAKTRRAKDVFDEPAESSRRVRGARKRTPPAVLPQEILAVSPSESGKFWSKVPAIKGMGETAAMDTAQYDRAVIALTQGKSYGVATLKEARLSGESAKTAFSRIEGFWDQFIPVLQERVYQLSMGKAELTLISTQEAGFDIVGHGKFFKLVRNVGRHREESVVWLTPEGVSVYPAPRQ
jgi:hypothetical protein